MHGQQNIKTPMSNPSLTEHSNYSCC